MGRFSLESLKLDITPQPRMVSATLKKAEGARVSRPSKNPYRPTLTEDQADAMHQMQQFLQEGQDTRSFLFTGAAGTGKTTVMAAFVEWCEENGISVALTAPTNKAARVLRETAGQYGLEVPCMTIFRMLHMKVNTDAEEKYAARNSFGGRCGMGDFDVVVIDECSMVGNRPPPTGWKGREPGLYDEIVAEQDSTGTKLIYVGDPNQLPPVKEDESPTFKIQPATHLTRVVRQAWDNPIIELATWIRFWMNGDPRGPCPEPAIRDGVGIEHISKWPDYVARVVSSFVECPDHPTRFKALSWRNRLVDSLNAKIRTELYGGAGWYEHGERYVSTQPVFNLSKTDRRHNGTIALNTDEDAVILNVEPFEHRDYSVPALALTMESDEAGVFETCVVHPDARQDWKLQCDEVARQAREEDRRLWKTFWQMHDAFAHLRPHYVMTVHRSQGSTYDTVFVNYDDIMKNPNQWEALRCLYVACTRSASRLVIYDPS